ncbi:MAG: tRNA pseudouridine65 synthase [Crocinitomix sp.]|jgi:tRNA pseudouridine65 synthase
MEIEILYEDDALIIVNKPNNILVHASYYARNIKEPSLLARLKESIPIKLYPVHRLDHKTSGVLILAKSAAFTAKIQKQFESNTIKKTYLALVRGFSAAKGIIDTPIQNAATGKYKDALTSYKTLEQTEVDIAVQPYPKSRYSLLEFHPETGRMHQLRKHANKISHPIIGDHKYGNRHHNKMFAEELNFPNMFLHASEIVLEHPETNESLIVKAPLPLFWNEAFTKINLTTNY